jgi:outer membrane protein insertion porin family
MKQKIYINLFKYIFLISFLLLLTSLAYSYDLSIKGNNRLTINDLQTLTSIDLKKDSYNKLDLDTILKDFYSSNLISDVKIEIISENAFIEILEASLINKIFINGNNYIKDEIILNQLNSKEGLPIEKNIISKDIRLINSIYNSGGYSNASVSFVTEKVSQSKSNIIISITEGLPSKIVNIDFFGNNFFSDGYLNNLIATKKVSFYNFFSNSSNFDESIFKYDLNRINNLYREYGFLNVKINFKLHEINKSNYSLEFYIEENDRLKIINISKEFDIIHFNEFDDLFQNLLSQHDKNNQFFEKSLFDKYVLNFNSILEKNNVSNVFIEYQITNEINDSKIIYKTVSTKVRQVNKINISGNSITKDKTLRSKIDFEPGDYFNENSLQNNLKKLENLKYINSLDFIVNDDGLISDINVEINENKKTGNFLFGGSFSGDTGFGLGFSIKDYNFLGSGNELQSSIDFNEERYFFDLNYIYYPLINSKVRHKYSIYNSEFDLISSNGFKSNKTGIGYNLLFDYSKNMKISTGFSLYNERNHSAVNSSNVVTDNIGNSDNIDINFRLIYDTTNDLMYPTSGHYNSANINYLPDAISDKSLYKLTLNNDNYFEIKKNDSFIFLSNKVGFSDSLNGNLRTVDSFSLGGMNFKGFDYKGIGPFNNNIYLGGKNFFTSTVGYGDNFIFDEKDNINIKLFYTAGSIWDTDYSNDNNFKIRSSAGISFDIIALLPISLSYSIPLQKESADKTRNFNFNIGTSF